MKTKIIVEIETPDAKDTTTVPEAGQSEDDFKGNEEELKAFREGYAKDLHSAILGRVLRYLDSELEEQFLDCEEELLIEDWDDFSCYGIKVTHA